MSEILLGELKRLQAENTELRATLQAGEDREDGHSVGWWRDKALALEADLLREREVGGQLYQELTLTLAAEQGRPEGAVEGWEWDVDGQWLHDRWLVTWNGPGEWLLYGVPDDGPQVFMSDFASARAAMLAASAPKN